MFKNKINYWKIYTIMKTLVVGASTNPERYSFIAANMLKSYGHEIILLGKKAGVVTGSQIETIQKRFEAIDTITMYVGATHQAELYDYLIELRPRRIIFNPGTENPVFEEKAKKAGIVIEEACTLVLLSTKQY
jgi:predicted CoA-binding protein